ncbi:MAG TPA: response regulator [Bacteroidales bacterium]|nr:response regulator [Bacteroidales bacterium]
MKKKPLIFVVDDDPMVLRLIQETLSDEPVKVMSFNYGEELIEKLHLGPDLIILDYIFEKKNALVMNGLEILTRIRDKNEDLPVIILSGQESGNTVLELMKAGIEDYIIKGKDFTVKLLIAVQEIINKR